MQFLTFFSFRPSQTGKLGKIADAMTDKDLVHHVVQGTNQRADDGGNCKLQQQLADRQLPQRIIIRR